MSRLDLTLFGPPAIAIDGKPINIRVDKSVALVALLALHGSSLHRDTLITYLWTGSDPSKANAALRTALWRLKATDLAPWLGIERDVVALNTQDIWIDIEEFQKNIKKTKTHSHSQDTTCPTCFPLLNRAIDLYGGKFMSGYSPRNADGFDEWRSEFEATLRVEYLNTLERLAKGYYQYGQYSQAIQITRRWLVVDALNEEAHNLIVRCYANIGQRTNAIAHYRTYKRKVEKTLNLPPSEEITSIYQHVLSGSPPPVDASEKLNSPTFLLLNIDHAPDLWAQHGNLMAGVVTRFAQLIRDGLRHCGGRIIQQSNDKFIVLFEYGQPVLCAIALQQLVAQTNWGLPDPPSVRMAIITTLKSQNTSPGDSVELAIGKQLLQAASGGQVLITDQAIHALGMPLSTRAISLGSYLIPGQTNPTQIYALMHPHLPTVKNQGLSTLIRAPANLPVQATRFVGRETELAQLTHLLAQPEYRLLTLVGPGGVGKTRLGIQAISQLQVIPPDGIFYVPLVTHTNPLTIHNPIAAALNFTFNNPGDPASQLIDQLRSKCMLLFLDNFEHLVPATPYLIDLLDAAPNLRIVITSRERLNLKMESIFTVQGLSFPLDAEEPDFEQFSGVQLFTQNARRVSPGFSVHPEDKPYIQRICSLVEGLPLGIELASAWVRAFSCQEIANMVQQNLDFLHTKSPDVPSRHRSLRAAFDYSWGLLSEEDRRIIGKLSVFRDGFSPQAAEHIARATPIMLASYVDKSMLTRQSDGRYLMPETLRVFVVEIVKSNPQEYSRLLDTHCEYYIDFSLKMFLAYAGNGGAIALRNSFLDSENIREAINRAIDQHNWPLVLKSIDPIMSAFELQGRIREGYEVSLYMRKLITKLVGMQQPDIYYSLLGWEGTFSFRLGFSQDALAKMSARLAYANSQGDMIHVANTLMFLADSHRRHGDLNTALVEITQSVEVLAQLSTSEDELTLGFYANALAIQGMIHTKLGQVELARQALTQCNAVLDRSETRYARIRALDLEARIAILEHRYKDSINLGLEAAAIAEEFNDRRNLAIIMNNLGHSAEQLEDWQGAIDHITRANQICNEIGDRQLGALTNNNLGFLNLRHNNPEMAIPHYEKSLALYREIVNIRGIYFTLRDLSRAYLLANRVGSGQVCLVEALQLGIKYKGQLDVLQILSVIPRLLAKMNRLERAIQLLSIVLVHPETTPYNRMEADALLAEIGDRSAASGVNSLPSTSESTLPTFQSLLAEISKLQPSLQGGS